MYPFPGTAGATYLGNGTYTRQPQQPAAAPSAPGGGLLSPSGGINYAAFNSAPGSGVAPQQAISAGGSNPSLGMYGLAGSPSVQGMAGYASMGSSFGGPFGSNPYSSLPNQFMAGGGFGGPFGGSPYAQNSMMYQNAMQNAFGGMNSMMQQNPFGMAMGNPSFNLGGQSMGMAGAASSGSGFGGPYASNPYSFPTG